MSTEMVEIFGTTKCETDKSVLIEFTDGEIWLPKEPLKDWPDIEEEGEVIMPYWLALNKDLI